MKTIVAIIAAAILTPASSLVAADPAWFDSFDALLKKYQTPTGVKYKAWHANAADRKALSDVVTAIGAAKQAGKSKDEQLAFYINAYNAWTLDKILSDYPTAGPGGGKLLGRNYFFKALSILVAGESLSLHGLENDIIRKKFDEPRIHFALNCASASCPPLHSKAFRAATLDKTLDKLTKSFVNNNPDGVGKVSSGKIAISKIFDWYKDDFKAAGGALAFINQHRTNKIPLKTKVSFQKYRWTLNESR